MEEWKNGRMEDSLWSRLDTREFRFHRHWVRNKRVSVAKA
jgi:hypothetical protein